LLYLTTMSKSKISLSGGEALLAAALLFATTNVLVREMAHMWGDQAQLAARFGLVWLILAVYARVKGVKVSIPRSKMLLVITYSALAALAILFYTLSIQMTTIANTLFTSSAIEIIGAFLLGTILLNERLTSRKFLAMGMSLTGLALYSDALLGGNAGIIFGLLAGITTAFCNLLAKKLKGVDRGAILRVQFGLGAILAVVLALLISANDIVRTISIEGTATTIIFALVLIAATHLVLYGFQHFDVNIASVILSSQLAFGALLGFLVFREVPAPNEIISGVLIACAAIIASTGKKPVANDIDVYP
jgi:drug/metabolite transporter (DMT)-like permease